MNNTYKTNKTDWRHVWHGAILAAALLVIGSTETAWGQTTPHATGIDGTTVYLNDLEDHSWAYYSDENCPVHSLNPADVKITYYGNGQTNNNVSDGTEGTGAPTNFVSKATGVQVNVGESANTFVYFKTLERANANGSGNLKYTAIPNPFQVRPTYGTASVSSTRTVYISWSCSRWYNSQYAQVYFVYTNASGTVTTSSTYQSNGNTTIDAKVGTTITLYARGSRNRTSATYNPTVTAQYDDNNGSTIVTCQSSGTSYTNNSGSVQEEIDNSIMRGFYAWRIKSLSEGLSIDGKLVGDIVYAEEEIEFVTSNAKGNEVEFEALWAQAYVNSSTYVSNSGSYRNAYERNFKVGTTITTYNYPVTFTTLNPSASSGSPSSVSYSGNYTCSNDVKFENMTLSMGNYYIDGNSYNLAIGRGVANGNNNVASSVYGDASPSSVRGDFTLRVESGYYTNSYIFHAGSNTSSSDAFTATAIYGSDYDRANNETNTGLRFTGSAGTYYTAATGSVEVGLSTNFTSTNTAVNMSILSGTFGANADNREVYVGFEGAPGASQTIRNLEVLGGDFLGGIAGGIESQGSGVDESRQVLNIRIKGGTIHRYLYGSGQFSAGRGSRRIAITGGTFDAWVAGGCYGTNPNGGATNGNINLYFGGDANQSNTDGIFGAGYGSSGTSDNSYTVMQSNVVFADDATTTGSVYGGGNNGYATDDIKVYLAGGHVAGNVFGGANKARSSQDVAVVVTGGSVDGGVYGGSNQSGAISGQITVDVYGTDPAPSANTYAIHQVFGGGNQAAYSGTPVVTVHDDNSCDISIEEVYGGGNQASVTGTNVTIEAGNIIGDVYGGGRQAAVGGNTSVTVNGGTIRRVFGGNNISGAISGTISVNVDKTSSCPMKIGQVFGGGNQAASQVGSITVGCTGDLVTPLADGQRYGYDQEGIGAVYGGANEAAITGDITLNIVSGIVDSVFGGNNAGGTIDGDITVNIAKNGSALCAPHWYVGYVFGGGNNAAYSQKTADHPEVNVSAGLVTNHVFGGGNGSGATVTGNPTVTLSGTAQVGGNVFGGGNAAAVDGNTSVKLQN